MPADGAMVGPHKIAEKVVDIIYLLLAECNGLMARSHMNRLVRLSERLVERQEGVGGIFLDTRLGIKSILYWIEK